MSEDLIKNIQPKSKWVKFMKRTINKYTITISAFLIWMIFFDSNSFLVIDKLNKEINKYENQLNYYKTEYEKNDDYYKRLMNDRSEKEKYARENYFMKKPNEEIFIIVTDSADTEKK